MRPDGLQFLTFKLSFNDYYAQDISNKIKSVKNRKIEKGEFQGGIAPYGYKKDERIKNHLIIDEYAANIVRQIFDMYVNRGMSTTKIADELNKKEILAPAEYLKIPIYMQKKSGNPNVKYLWLRAQIGKILKNEVYIGNVVGRKYQKVSHKIAKVRMTKEEERVIVENMHEPIIDLDTWNKAQEKLKSKVITRDRKYDQPLKGLIFCKECGKIATLRCRTETRKSGAVWRADYFICSNRNSYTGLCDCKQIQAKIIEDEIKNVLKQEMQKITYSKEELKRIYKESQIELKEEKNKLDRKLKKYNEKINSTNSMLKDLYEDKTNNIITLDDFEMFYKDTLKEKEEYIEKIEDELTTAGTLPYSFLSDDKKLTVAIRSITEWQRRNDFYNNLKPEAKHNIYDVDLRHGAYNLFVEALIEMLTPQPQPMKLKGAFVSYSKVYDRLVPHIKQGEYSTGLYLETVEEAAVEGFINGCRDTEIRNHLQYMKACIWTALQTGEIGVLAQIKHDFG